ncbi:hypothetical protein SLS62_010168 [Diatrype stigma]|uniref:Uncharacterized protein n=1 Tax=Diatrype stigma TaxID=117547 RepID=A0AAN9YJ69_9PEZI
MTQRPISGAFETPPPPPANISAARVPANVPRPSPEPQAAHNFPPPPNSGGRGASRERRFGLPSLSRRREREHTNSPPDTHPPVSIARPQPLTVQVPRPLERADAAADQSGIPPAARRAASASAIDTPISARSRSTSQSRWEPGMPLPPPPPVPPPPQSRSQSLSRTSEPIMSPPTRRPPPSGVTALGPVPPTPADWARDERQGRGKSPSTSGLTIDTSSVESSGSTAAPPDSASGSSSAGGGLNRTGAVRGEKSLRERRTESRTRQSSGESEAGAQPLSNIIVPQGPSLSRRISVRRGTPRSGRSMVLESEDTIDSRNSTPRPSAGLHLETSTPPFSPHSQKAYPATEHAHAVAPKSLPTPPPQSRSASSSSQTRPDIHSSIGSLISTPVSARHMSKHTVISQTAEQFCQGSIERFQAFAQAEASARSDADRVKLFADFIVSESRQRRERYSSAIGAMGSEIFDLTRDLFRPMNPPRRDSSASQASEWTPQTPEPRSQQTSFGSPAVRDQVQQSNSAPPSAGLPPQPPPPATNGPLGSGNWNSQQYMPSLSPILSMSVSEALDEADSRGRPASRWWEADSTGEGGRLERTKRESKYMGVPKEAREALQWEDGPSSSSEGQSISNNPYATSGEYPPEKVGWHEQQQNPEQQHASPNIATPQQQRPFRQSLTSSVGMPTPTPHTPSATPAGLDVSRLVTLPPPYPRHHPAVNNNHPELAAIRVAVRALSDLSAVRAAKEQFRAESAKRREEAGAAAAERRRVLRTNLQAEIAAGHMSYAEAAAIEADGQLQEKAQARETEKRDFDGLQTRVVLPLNEMLTGRIAQATALFDELRAGLLPPAAGDAAAAAAGSGSGSGGENYDPNLPQEEGDEQPELLEKLTLLKWIFEAREALHREIYDLLTDRNDRYRDMVLTPYRLSGNAEKLRGAEAFFAEDAAKRRAASAAEALARAREFRAAVEDTVGRGVAMQLNAFWDIAPPLRRLLDKIQVQIPPQDADDPTTTTTSNGGGGGDFRIQIPAAEYEENPVYRRHPLQYLFSLLLHAEKSTYQFIESQTNLQCLLHEVKEAEVGAHARARLAEIPSNGSGSGNDPACVEAERQADMSALTEDLKEKVRVVQDQWTGALGDAMKHVKERVGEYLLSTGGWDESLEDRGVGSV